MKIIIFGYAIGICLSFASCLYIKIERVNLAYLFVPINETDKDYSSEFYLQGNMLFLTVFVLKHIHVGVHVRATYFIKDVIRTILFCEAFLRTGNFNILACECQRADCTLCSYQLRVIHLFCTHMNITKRYAMCMLVYVCFKMMCFILYGINLLFSLKFPHIPVNIELFVALGIVEYCADVFMCITVNQYQRHPSRWKQMLKSEWLRLSIDASTLDIMTRPSQPLASDPAVSIYIQYMKDISMHMVSTFDEDIDTEPISEPMQPHMSIMHAYFTDEIVESDTEQAELRATENDLLSMYTVHMVPILYHVFQHDSVFQIYLFITSVFTALSYGMTVAFVQ